MSLDGVLPLALAALAVAYAYAGYRYFVRNGGWPVFQRVR